MTPMLNKQLRISTSVRFVLAVMRLIAGNAENWGKYIVDLLKKQYPDQNVDADPGQVGRKLMYIAMKENQYNQDRAMDAIADWFKYIIEKKWDFSKDSKTWEEALANIYTNVRRRSMTKSIDNQKRKKRDKTVDDAFGKRGEGGEAPEGGEGRMPTPSDTELGKALDDKAAIKKFMELMEENMPILRDGLPLEQRVLFNLVFDENIGTFSSDVKENMGQAAALKEKLEKGTPEEQALLKKNEKRWSGFVGDTRKKLLDSINNFIETEMTPDEVDIIWDEFYSDTTPGEVRKLEKKKDSDRVDYQRGIDERKIARWKWEEQQGTLAPKEQKSFETLKAKLKKEGVDVDAIQPSESPEGGVKKKLTLNSLLARVAAAGCKPLWL